MSQLTVLGLSIHGSPTSSRSKSSTSSYSSDCSSPGDDTDGPAAYHSNLANLLPSLYLPPPLRGMSRLRAAAQRQWVGSLDVLGILTKAVMRPHPVINLGPIDHTASCVIVDLDLPDRPLVWASESFCQMSGYALDDIRGRNPRFMQAPGGHVLTPQSSRPGPNTHPDASSSETITPAITAAPPAYTYIPPPASHVPAGSERTHTDKPTVAHMRTRLDAHEEVQTTILNYRRDGTPFWNWISIVPVREAGENSRFRYHVGIMVDLVQQPRAIMQNMQAGFYVRSQA